MPNLNDPDSKSSEQAFTLGNSGEIAASGGLQILSLLAAIASGPSGIAITAFGAGSTVLLGAWQTENQKRFEKRVVQELSQIDQKKLDKEAFQSSEFKEIVLRIYNESGLTESSI